MSLLRNFKPWVPVFLWMGIIFLMSTTTFSSQNTSLIIGAIFHFLAPSFSRHQMEIVNALIRKSGHVTEYFILGILLFHAFSSGSPEKRIWRRAFLSILVVALYAASDELHQSFVSTRTPSLADVGIDTAAGILAQGVSVLWHHRRQR